jgi:protein-tyrosine-phosphatase/glycosyltransferase involved in cell wall biosynthesis
VRILWVKVGGLWPADAGGRLRSFHLLAELARRHRITVLTTHAPGEDPSGLVAALPALAEVASVPFAVPGRRSARFAAALLRSWLSPLPVDLHKFRCPALRAEVDRRLVTGAYDLCVADFLSATANVPPRAPVPVVLFAHNVEHRIWRRLAAVERRPLVRPLLEVEWRKLRRAEARACAAARLTLAVSEADREVLRALAPGADVRAVPTGVDTDYFAPRHGAETPGRLVFTGSMDWHPNEDAVLHFLATTLPRIRREAPEARLDVVGRNPSRRLREAVREAGAAVSGTVPDVRPYLAEAAVVVVPLRVGGGTRLKIFEALAMGKAVVSTGVGAEGLPIEPGTHYERADDPVEFAAAVVGLLRDPARRRALGEAGRRLVASRHTWAAAALRFEAECARAAAGPRAAIGSRTAAGTPAAAGPRDAASPRTPPRRAEAAGPARGPGIAALRRHLRGTLRVAPRARRLYWRLQVRRFLGKAAVPPDVPAGSLLFVCHGNIIRSPMAAALMRRRLGERGAGGVEVRSAGLHAVPGRPADGRAEMAAAEFGVSLRGHRARPLSSALVRRADLIFAMDTLNQAELLARHPEAADKVFLLGAEAPDRRGRPIEIADPFAGAVADIRRCYRLLDGCVARRAERIAARAGGGREEERHAG